MDLIKVSIKGYSTNSDENSSVGSGLLNSILRERCSLLFFLSLGSNVEESMKIVICTVFLSSFQILREKQNRPFQAF
jgi:hypothetical protein